MKGLLTIVLVSMLVKYLRPEGPAISQDNEHKYVYDTATIFNNKIGYV
jgi:hypothetical protein